MDSMFYTFDSPLKETVISRRRNRFIMEILIDGKIVDAHCPSTGSIGGIKDFENIPCLVSEHSESLTRKTKYTVEAISFDLPNVKNKTWIGINQTQANRYIEFFLKSGVFSKMIPKISLIERERKLGNSRLDFRVNGNTFIEVKTPLIKIQLEYPEHIILSPLKSFTSYDRLVKHVNELSSSLDTNEKAILLSCYLYNNENFIIPKSGGNIPEIVSAIQAANLRGVENWAVNFQITPSGIELLEYGRTN